MAAYGKAGDCFRFYEIDEDVMRLAREFFTFIPKCPANVEMVSGDARLSLEREPPQRFDVLVLDAFSGDTVPVHLLTADAFAVYLRHLSRRGVIAVHTSSQYVDLAPVVHRIAEHYDLRDVVVNWPRGSYTINWAEEMGYAVTPSQWMLLTQNAQVPGAADDPRRVRNRAGRSARAVVDGSIQQSVSSVAMMWRNGTMKNVNPASMFQFSRRIPCAVADGTRSVPAAFLASLFLFR